MIEKKKTVSTSSVIFILTRKSSEHTFTYTHSYPPYHK